MNGQQETKLINAIIFICGVIVITLLVRAVFIVPNLDRDGVCRFEYGENWRYENTKDFGETCLELDFVTLEVTNRTKIDLTGRDAINRYCNVPGFFEFNKWAWDCKYDE